MQGANNQMPGAAYAKGPKVGKKKGGKFHGLRVWLRKMTCDRWWPDETESCRPTFRSLVLSLSAVGRHSKEEHDSIHISRASCCHLEKRLEESQMETETPIRSLDGYLRERWGGLDLEMAVEMVRSGQILRRVWSWDAWAGCASEAEGRQELASGLRTCGRWWGRPSWEDEETGPRLGSDEGVLQGGARYLWEVSKTPKWQYRVGRLVREPAVGGSQ